MISCYRRFDGYLIHHQIKDLQRDWLLKKRNDPANFSFSVFLMLETSVKSFQRMFPISNMT